MGTDKDLKSIWQTDKDLESIWQKAYKNDINKVMSEK